MDTDTKTSTSEPSDATTTAAAATVANSAQQEDEFMAQKLQAVEQLYNVFGFSYDVAQQAVEYIAETILSPSLSDDPTQATTKPSIDITACYNYILDSGLGQDHGGPVTPIEDCPHVTNHCKISIEQIPIQPSHTLCSFALSMDDTTNKPKGNLKSDIMYDDFDDDAGGDTMKNTSTNTTNPMVCKAKENWLCLECGIVRCSRYCLGHALQHWEESRQRPEHDGHCVAVSLSDLSVWCHVCQSYLSTHIGSTGHAIQPLVSQLEYNKFHLEGDTTILMDTSPVHVQPPHTKKIKHHHDNDDDGVEDDDEAPSGDQQNTADKAVDETAPEENGKSF
jgi:Zn-finger in ubiquitin-hydrolases and other protein